MLKVSPRCSIDSEKKLNTKDPRDMELVKIAATMMDLTELPQESAKLLLRCVRFLKSCGYHIEDVCLILAHSNIYFLDVCQKCGKMPHNEAVHIIMVLMYMAHAYVQDEHCPLHVWHEYLFRSYCKLATLDKALYSMMKMRGYILRVDEADVKERHARLLASHSNATLAVE